MSIVSWKIGEWGEEFGGMVGGGNCIGIYYQDFTIALGSLSRMLFRIPIASGSLSRRDLYRAGISIRIPFYRLRYSLS